MQSAIEPAGASRPAGIPLRLQQRPCNRHRIARIARDKISRRGIREPRAKIRQVVLRRDHQRDYTVANLGVDDPAIDGVEGSAQSAPRIELVVEAVLDVDGLDVALRRCCRLERHRQWIVVGKDEDGAAFRHGPMMPNRRVRRHATWSTSTK